MAVDLPRGALGMEGDEVERRADSVRGVVLAAEAVLEEGPRPVAAAAGGVGTADAGGGEGTAHPGDGVVMKFEELFAGSLPVGDVRFVPGLPVPGAHFVAAVAV